MSKVTRLARPHPREFSMRSLPSLDRFWTTVRRLREPNADVAPVLHDDRATALRDLDAIRSGCRALVARRAAVSAGAAVVPIPGLDIGTDVAILVDLLPKINERFGLSAAQIDALDVESKRIVMVLVGVVGSSLVGRVVTRELVLKLLLKMGVRVTTASVARFVPLVGQALSATISYGAMRAIGNKHVDDCYEVARRALVDATPR